MKKNITCLFAWLSLLAMLIFYQPVAMAHMELLDTSLLPEDTIAVVISPSSGDQPRMIYAIYGITKDDKTLSVSVRQISTDPELTVYNEDVVNVDEQDIRIENFFTSDQPIIGSYCEAYIESNPDGKNFTDRWSYSTFGSLSLCGYYMDEQFTFSLSELGDIDEKIIFQIQYNCIAAPGTLADHPLCLFTIDISDYLHPDTMPDLKTLDTSLLPEDTIAVTVSPSNGDQPRIYYAIHGITRDDETMSVGVRQISTNPKLMIYEEDTANMDEQHIRWVYAFSKDTPIVGSYCEALIENDKSSENLWDRWCYYQQNSCMRHGYYMDETFLFVLSELGDIDETITLRLSYHCIPVPGILDGHNLCLMTVDIADYLK